MRPIGLTNFFARQELSHDGLDVENGCAVDRVEADQVKHRGLAPKDARQRTPEAVRSILSALGEYADGWPIGAISRVTSTGDDLSRFDAIEVEEDLDVGELLDSVQRIGREAFVQLDATRDVAPVVIAEFGAWRAHDADRCDFDIQ